VTYRSLTVFPLNLCEVVDTLGSEAHRTFKLHRHLGCAHDASDELAILNRLQAELANLFAQDTQLLLTVFGRLLHA